MFDGLWGSGGSCNTAAVCLAAMPSLLLLTHFSLSGMHSLMMHSQIVAPTSLFYIERLYITLH